MCGIILGINEAITTEMIDDLSHRGFSNTLNSYFSNTVHLGHIRLPIQGLSNEFDQPMQYRHLIGAFVGEVLNFKELGDPCAKTDLPVILEKFDRFGPSCVYQFDGFWSIIIIDLLRAKIHILTDDLAKKPLYIRKEDDRLMIASEIRPLKRMGNCTLDEVYLAAVAKWGYCIEDRTPFNEIKLLPRSTHLCLDIKTLKEDRYFIPTIGPMDPSDLRMFLETAVKNRLVSDVPVSVLLSGGLDSTIIFELIKKHTRDFTVFHVANDEEEYLNHLNFRGIPVKKLSLEDIPLQRALYWNETPVDLGSVQPQLALSRAISHIGFRVALSGDGADELFGGYRRINEYDSQWSDIFHELVYYHLPRLDKLMMANTVELRNPYLSRNVISSALGIPYEHRINKRYLKELFCDIVPLAILEREKWPLKIKAIREDKMKQRLFTLKLWRELNECKRCSE